MPTKLREISIVGDLAFVPLTGGYVATIDAKDVCLVSGRNWSANVAYRRDGKLRTVYAYNSSQGKKTKLHRLITGALEGYDVDHIDGDGLNNRRANLRIATRIENSRNARLRADNTSGVKGVTFAARQGKWVAQIAIDGRCKRLGAFTTKEAAAEARIAAERTLFGEFRRAV